MYCSALVRVLALGGPGGLSTADIATRGLELGLLAPERLAPEQRGATLSGLTRAASKDYVAHVGGYRYALKALDGVQEVPRPGKGGGSGGSIITPGGGPPPTEGAQPPSA